MFGYSIAQERGFVKQFAGIFDFFIFLGKGREGKGMGRGECKLGIWGGLYKMGIKVEFGGFIGGFGKIFFTKGGIKRKGMGFWRDGGRSLYFF